MDKHPYEGIEVDYAPPERPEHLVEGRYIKTGESFHTEYRVFFDGHPMTDEQQAEHGWKKLSRWITQTKAWKERESYGNNDRYDAIQIALKRREVAFGEPSGSPSSVAAGFESWLMDNGFRPVMLDRLNAMSPGRVLGVRRMPGGEAASVGPFLAYTHVYWNGVKWVSFQFGYGPFNFVFMVDGKGPYQVPVDESLFQDAIDCKLRHLDELLRTSRSI